MHSIVLVGACLAFVGHAHRTQTTNLQQQVKHTAQRLAENSEMPQLKKLAMLLLASNSMSGGTYSHTWALGDEKGRALSAPIAGTHSQAEVEFQQRQEQIAEQQTPPEFDNSWGLGDEKGRTFAEPIAGTHSQAEVEFKQKQKNWRDFFAGRGGARSADVQAPIDNTWALGDEKGRAFAGPITGTHSQAEVEFLQKEKITKAQAAPKFNNSWGLGDEKGRTFAGPISGTHSQAEVEFTQKQRNWGRFASLGGAFSGRGGAKSAEVQAPSIDNTWAFGTENGRTFEGPIVGTHSQAEVEFMQKEEIAKAQAPPKFDNSWGLSDEKGRTFAGPIAGTHSQAEVEFEQKQEKWRRR